MCNPKEDASFYSTWSDFEVKYGNEDTFKEMLRIKRSVQSKFNSQIAVQSIPRTNGMQSNEQVQGNPPKTMAELEEQVLQNTSVSGFVRAKYTEPTVTIPTPMDENPEKLELNESDEE